MCFTNLFTVSVAVFYVGAVVTCKSSLYAFLPSCNVNVNVNNKFI